MPFGKILEPLFRQRFVSHLVFWISIVLVLAYHGSLFGGTFRDNLINMQAILPVQVLTAYFLIYWLIPELLYRKRWIAFLFLFTVSTYTSAVLARLAIIHIAEPILGAGEYDESVWEVMSDPKYLIQVYLPSVYLPAVVLFMVKMTKERFVNENRLIHLQSEKRTAELNFLKAQINPHFLFNVLNSLYALSRERSDLTSDMILKLSDILDYTIYECQDDRVSLAKEWSLIENYADLETLRFSDPVDVTLQQEIENLDVKIAPLILIGLVENAFKFSLKNPSAQPTIKLILKQAGGEVNFHVQNSKNEIPTDESRQGGIGLENLRRQLQLVYPQRHQLSVVDRNHVFETRLTIQLD